MSAVSPITTPQNANQPGASVFTFARSARPPWRAVLAALPVLTAICLIAGTTWTSAFPLSALIVPVVLSVAFTVIVALFTRKQPILVALAAHVAAFIVVAHVTVLRSASIGGTGIPSGRSFQLLGEAIRDGWSRMLTSPLPMRFENDRSPVVVISTVVATALAAQLLLRTRIKLASVIGPIGLLLVTRIFGATGPGRWIAAAIVVVALAAVIAVLLKPDVGRRARGDTGPVALRRSGLGTGREPVGRNIGVGVVVALVAALVSQMVPLRKAADPRRVPTPDRDLANAVNPLSLLGGWTAKPERELFRFKVVDAKTATRPTRWRIAVLDTFTGATWRPGTKYVDAKRNLPDAPLNIGLDPTAPRVKVDVELGSLGDGWLPIPGFPTEIQGISARIDAPRGVLRERKFSGAPTEIAIGAAVPSETTTPTSSFVKTASYRVEAAPVLMAVPADAVGFDTTSDSLERLAVPRLPEPLRAVALDVTSAGVGPLERARRLEAHLQSRKVNTFNPNSQPGHSYQRLAVLLQDVPPKGRQGTSEQFATAFAVLARSLGMPTRVVVGFDVPADAPVSADGFVTVTSKMAKAWPEIRFANVGWVPFNPTPDPGDALPEDDEDDENNPGGGTTTTLAGGEETVAPTTVGEPVAPGGSSGTGFPRWLRTLSLLVLAFGGLFGGLRFLNVRARAALRAGPARGQVHGAWLDAMRSLRATGTSIGRGESVREFVVRYRNEPPAAELLPAESSPKGADEVSKLGSLLDRSTFGQNEPEPSEIDAAWASADSIRAHTMQVASFGTKLQLLLDPRPIRG